MKQFQGFQNNLSFNSKMLKFNCMVGVQEFQFKTLIASFKTI